MALLSVLVYDRNVSYEPHLNENLLDAKAKLVEVTEGLARVQMEHGLGPSCGGGMGGWGKGCVCVCVCV